MKSKLVTITALLAVIVAMTGTAAAFTLDLYNKDIATPCDGGSAPNPIVLAPGDSVILSLHATQLLKNNDTYPLSETHTSDLTVAFISGVTFGPVGTSGTFCKSDAVKVTLSTNPTNAINTFNVTAGPGSKSAEIQTASRSINVPEFPAVALPVGAAIGLVFLFQQRKRKLE